MEKVSIIFVHYGQNEARRKLAIESIDSLYKSVKHLPCEIIVVDNGGGLEESNAFLQMAEHNKITHYIRNSSNLWFGRGRNQAIDMAEGDYIVVVDNDLVYEKGWLENSLVFLKKANGKKLMVSLVDIIRSHRKHTRKEVIDGQEITVNVLAGSNGWMMTREQWKDIGRFEDHHFSGTLWCRTYARKGYALIVPDKTMVKDMGDKRTQQFGYVRFRKTENQREIIIKKRLINEEEIIYYKGFL